MINLTRYELQAIAPNGQKFLAGYVRIPSLAAAARMLRQNGQDWVRITGCEEFTITGKGKNAWKIIIGQWVISYSGRTKLEAEISQLPFFKNYER